MEATPTFANVCYGLAQKVEIKLSFYLGSRFKSWNTDSQRMERALAHYILSTSIGFSSTKFLLWRVGVAFTYLQYHKGKKGL